MAAYTSVQSYLASIFPNDDVRKHVTQIIANAIHSDQPAQKLYIFNGPGGSGKSQFVNFLKNVYGTKTVDYVSTHILLKPKNNYIFDGLNEKRIGLMADPEVNQKIDNTVLKNVLTNNISLMYGRQINFNGILIMLCNTVPEIEENDFNSNHIEIINFESKFDTTVQNLGLDTLTESFREYIPKF